jgi:hypothetical protein
MHDLPFVIRYESLRHFRILQVLRQSASAWQRPEDELNVAWLKATNGRDRKASWWDFVQEIWQRMWVGPAAVEPTITRKLVESLSGHGRANRSSDEILSTSWSGRNGSMTSGNVLEKASGREGRMTTFSFKEIRKRFLTFWRKVQSGTRKREERQYNHDIRKILHVLENQKGMRRMRLQNDT